MYAGTTARIGQTGPSTIPVTRSTTPMTPIVSAINNRRDDCHTTISALLSNPARVENGERPSMAPRDNRAGSLYALRGLTGDGASVVGVDGKRFLARRSRRTYTQVIHRLWSPSRL